MSVYLYDQEEESWKEREQEQRKNIQALESSLEEKIRELKSLTNSKSSGTALYSVRKHISRKTFFEVFRRIVLST